MKSTCECGRTWRGLSEEHCTECHRHFGGDTAFLAHRISGICRDPSGLKRKDEQPRFKVIMRNDGAVWVTAKYPSKANPRVTKPAYVPAYRNYPGRRSVAVVTRNQRRRRDADHEQLRLAV